MATATVTSKGQITIPVEVRRAMGLEPGTKVFFAPNEKGEFVLSRSCSLMELAGCLKGPYLSDEEMNWAILQRAAELDEASKSSPDAKEEAA